MDGYSRMPSDDVALAMRSMGWLGLLKTVSTATDIFQHVWSIEKRTLKPVKGRQLAAQNAAGAIFYVLNSFGISTSETMESRLVHQIVQQKLLEGVDWSKISPYDYVYLHFDNEGGKSDDSSGEV